MSTIGGPTTSGGPDSKTEQAKDIAQEKGQQAAQQARRGIRDQVDTRSTQAGERVSTVAQDARSVADELRNQGKDQPAKLAEQAAQRVESLGDYLQRSDGDTILRDVEDFGRRQPWAVIAGGLALGFAASRFLKASSERRYEQRSYPTTAMTTRPSTTTQGLTNGAPTTRTGQSPVDVTGVSGGTDADYPAVPAVPPVPPARDEFGGVVTGNETGTPGTGAPGTGTGTGVYGER